MISIAEYIADQILQLGGKHLFSVPGNYTAEFLLAAESRGMVCVGTTNELEAGYAADAYSRYAGIGVCSGTYGVGSHSLYNAIAGSYVEKCPVVLVNGSPPVTKVELLKERGILFAHAIDPLRTDELIFRPVTVATTVIDNAYDAKAEVDRVLEACVQHSRPVYLEVNQGVWVEPCIAHGRDTPLVAPVDHDPSERDIEAAVEAATTFVLDKIASAESPVLWGGELLRRVGRQGDFAELIRRTGLPYTTTLMAKGIISETAFPDQFIGVYDSKFAPTDIKQVVEQSDCLIALGTILSDFYADIVTNSHENMILASSDAVRIGPHLYPNVPFGKFVERLTEKLCEKERRTVQLGGFEELVADRTNGESFLETIAVDAPITIESFFARLAEEMTDETVLLVDTSLALFPSAEVLIHRPNGYLAQTAWLSIGYTCGATLGAGLAQPGARTFAVVGDGGFQMTPQAFSTLVRQEQPSIVFVIDNGTYGIEQFLVDLQILPKEQQFFYNRLPEASFFDVLPRWDYVKFAEALGGKGAKAATVDELNQVFSEFDPKAKVPLLVAVEIDQHDLPSELAVVVEAANSTLQSLEHDADASVTLRLNGFD